jgi:hypothetical protein
MSTSMDKSKILLLASIACALLTGCHQSDEEFARKVGEHKKKERSAIKAMDEHRLRAEGRACDLRNCDDGICYWAEWRCLVIHAELSRRGMLEPLQKSCD